MYSKINIKMARAQKYTIRRLLVVTIFSIIWSGVWGQDEPSPGEPENLVYRAQFVYDYNMSYTDFFAQQVSSVTLYLIDKENNVVWQKTEDGENLTEPGFFMDLDVDPGEYSLLVWCGTKNYGSFTVATNSLNLTGLTCTLAREHDMSGNAYSDTNLDNWFHGYLEEQTFPDDEGTYVYTVGLTKDTNLFYIVLRNKSGNTMNPNDYTVTITADNGYMAWDNSLIEDEDIEYRPWDIHTVTEEDLSHLSRAKVGDLVAELSTSRLVLNNNPTLTVTHSTEGELLSVSLIDYALRLKTNYSQAMDDQEFLDREDVWEIVVLDDEAPTLKAGFSNINYPNDYEPCLRLGLEQLEKCGQDTPFTINLHGATYITDDGSVDHLGVSKEKDGLYLVDTDDPEYTTLLEENEGEIVVGKVLKLFANVDEGNDTNAPSGVTGSYMQMYFFSEDSSDGNQKQLNAKEGYYYELNVYFEEEDITNDPIGQAYDGVLPIKMKIVPEYLVWTGDKEYNWNNDSNWKRVSATSINGTKDESSPYFTDGNNTNTNGFVPMLFSKVIIPKDSEAELYMAGFIEEEVIDEDTGVTSEKLCWEGDEQTDEQENDLKLPTSNIMYDLMLYENLSTGALKTEHYRVNLCDQIHFEPEAELLYSEQLIYNKAWTDVELSQGSWTLAATPLRDVASGDWYTKSTGTETAEYFTDINFDSNCDRVSSMVYQRSWSNSGNQIIYNSGTDKTVPAYASTGWSSVYNDVSVVQQAGEGFSIKAYNVGTSDLMFRFPKADETYQYQDGTSSTMTDAKTTISRENAGRLLISSLVVRTDPDKDDDDVYSGEVTVELTQTGNAYYIIGNPFTAPMSMTEFLKENSQFKGYWLESTYGPIAGSATGTSWGTADCLIEPYSAFFVTTDENDISPLADNPVTVTFTKAMQTFEVEDEVEKRSLVAFSVRASNDVGTTGASLSYSKEAIDGYNVSEDAVLMQDASWKKDGMPLVYTIADDMAVSVNKLNALTLVPLGCFADDDLEYTLTFVGVENLNEPSLYDAYTNTDTPLTEGYTLEMTGESHGRYFIRSKGPSLTGIEEIVEDVVYSMSAYSPTTRTIIVSSEAGIDNIEVYSLGGILLSKASVGGNITCTLDGIESGIAIVKAHTLEGTFVRKIRVK